MANKSKVKSYARRTKKGISRVTGHDRDNKNKRNRNIAIGVGVGTSVLALGLGAKHLTKKKSLSKPNTPKTQALHLDKTVRLKTKKPRRVVTLKNTEEWADVLITERGLPKGIKVEHLNLERNSRRAKTEVRLPKTRSYSETKGEIYTHGTPLDSLKSIKKSGQIKRSGAGVIDQKNGAMFGEGVYLEQLPAHRNPWGTAVFEFPKEVLDSRNLTQHDYGIFKVDGDLPISEASKLLLKRVERIKGRGKPKNIKIRYKKRLSKLISFIKKAATLIS